jgi:alkylation response protein AidB-like acyl-CoA dehydrogenase
MAVGMKSMATLSTAYLNALAYAKERVQGPDLTRAMRQGRAAGPKILEARRRAPHADAARSPTPRACAPSGLFTAHIQDQVELWLGGHARRTPRRPRRAQRPAPAAGEGLLLRQGAGAAGPRPPVPRRGGYCRTYPGWSSTIRDQKIDTLYEGTTHIQALDLFFRKVARDRARRRPRPERGQRRAWRAGRWGAEHRPRARRSRGRASPPPRRGDASDGRRPTSRRGSRRCALAPRG